MTKEFKVRLGEKMGKQPKVLIVILNYGTFDLTIKLVEDLRTIAYENYDVMVVDNCSPNESVEVLASKSEENQFFFYANKVNAGYAAGNNIGIRYAIEHGYDYSWIINNDVELREKHILNHMVQIMENNNEIGCVGPKVYSLDGSICAPYCNRQNLWNMTFGICADKTYRMSQKDMSQNVYRVYGCCMLLKNSVMRDVDCMDERTFLYGEESILAERMLTIGSYSFYDAEVSVIHMESATMKRMTANKKKMVIKESQKSREIYLRDYRQYNKLARILCHGVKALIWTLQS